MKRFLEAVAKYLKKSDTLLLALCLTSSAFGMLLIGSATRNDPGNYIFVQTVGLVLGVILYVLASLIDIDIIADKYKLLLALGVVFMCTLFIWGKADETGNRSWLRFSFGFGIQPAEVVKIMFIIIIARMISLQRDARMLNSLWSMARIIGAFALLFALIIVTSADLGSALVYVFILLVTLYMGGAYLRWFALGLGAVTAASPLLWTKFLTETQKKRILVIFWPDNLDQTRTDLLWQVTKSVEAISSGGFFGQGYKNGRLTGTGYVAHQHTDFIFSAAGEEFGFLGCLLILLLLAAIAIRCFYVGVKSNDKLGLLVCSGVGAMIIFQTLENVGMCLGVTPVVGLTLPFFSYGGSSVFTTFAAMGLVSGIKMRPKSSRNRYNY